MTSGQAIPAQSITGVVLAGGRSSRMGDRHKAHLELAGETLLERVVKRMRSQVDRILISVEPGAQGFEAVRHTLVEDLAPSHRGPLAGLYAALSYMDRHLDTPWLLVSPCDGPFLPSDLAECLSIQALQTGKPVCAAVYESHAQPTFSLWHRDALAEVRIAALEKGRGGLMSMLAALDAALVEWPARDIAPFFNVNTPEDLDCARAWLDPAGVKA